MNTYYIILYLIFEVNFENILNIIYFKLKTIYFFLNNTIKLLFLNSIENKVRITEQKLAPIILVEVTQSLNLKNI